MSCSCYGKPQAGQVRQAVCVYQGIPHKTLSESIQFQCCFPFQLAFTSKFIFCYIRKILILSLFFYLGITQRVCTQSGNFCILQSKLHQLSSDPNDELICDSRHFVCYPDPFESRFLPAACMDFSRMFLQQNTISV